MSFSDWLRNEARRGRADEVGEFARFYQQIPRQKKPTGGKFCWKKVLGVLRAAEAPPESIQAGLQAYREWQEEGRYPL